MLPPIYSPYLPFANTYVQLFYFTTARYPIVRVAPQPELYFSTLEKVKMEKMSSCKYDFFLTSDMIFFFTFELLQEGIQTCSIKKFFPCK